MTPNFEQLKDQLVHNGQSDSHKVDRKENKASAFYITFLLHETISLSQVFIKNILHLSNIISYAINLSMLDVKTDTSWF